MKFNLGKSLLLFLQGALIGIGAILPGISGGVLCAAFGIYAPMMAFLSHPTKHFKRNVTLLLPVLLGAGAGFILLAKGVEKLLEFSPIPALALFCGLICGTVPDLAVSSVEKDAKKGWIGFILSLTISFIVFSFLSKGIEGRIAPNFFWFIFCGAIWGLSMVIPGLSSSSVLLFLGLYKPMAQGIGDLDWRVLLPMFIGFIATIAATASGINFLLRKYAPIVTKIILGFVISSVLLILPPISGKLSIGILIPIGTFTIGFIIAAVMSRAKEKLNEE